MRPDKITRQSQAGLGLISAIFLITVGALLAAGMASFIEIGQRHTVQSFQATRAMQAAESGIQLELNKLIHPQFVGGCAAANTATATTTYNATGIKGCRSVVSCNVTSINGVDYVTIESVGRCGGTTASLESASRRIKVRAVRP